ncbi:IPTL-CTERM sorting domain-containing protein, partial [Xylophilus sp. ASV27]|uniref:IPTL-CTERM sorting domain-containing protein n=1 Tax=Xylophilus sp. ASV27 TaxID=2795129 RepID=UPI0018EC77C6
LGGQTRNRIGRLSVPEAALQALELLPDRARLRWWRSGSGPELAQVRFAVSQDQASWTNLGAATYVPGGWALDGLDAAALPRNRNLWLRAEGLASGGYFNGSTSLHRSVRQVYLAAPTVTPSVSGAGGQISPATPQVLDLGSVQQFTLQPASGWRIASVGGTCGGTLVGSTYTTAALAQDCTVVAQFAQSGYSAPSPGGQGTLTTDIQGNNCAFDTVSYPAAPATLPPGATAMPYGLLSFQATCDQAGRTLSLRLSYPGNALPANAQYWKYGPTAQQPQDHWYALDASQVQITGNTVTLSITDGGPGDSDLAADGRIVDPGGIAIMAAAGPNPTAIPLLQPWMLAAMSLALAVLGARGLRRR